MDVAALGNGQVLALAVPEQLWRSADLGLTWKRVAGEPFAARHFAPRPGAVDIRFGLRPATLGGRLDCTPEDPPWRAALHPVTPPRLGAR